MLLIDVLGVSQVRITIFALTSDNRSMKINEDDSFSRILNLFILFNINNFPLLIVNKSNEN